MTDCQHDWDVDPTSGIATCRACSALTVMVAEARARSPHTEPQAAYVEIPVLRCVHGSAIPGQWCTEDAVVVWNGNSLCQLHMIDAMEAHRLAWDQAIDKAVATAHPERNP